MDADDAPDVEPTGTTDPDLPDDIDPRELDADVRGELRTLNGPLSTLPWLRIVTSKVAFVPGLVFVVSIEMTAMSNVGATTRMRWSCPSTTSRPR